MKMRTTIDVDEDVLMAAKELARKQRVSMGKIVSGLLREAMSGRYTRSEIHHDLPAKAGGFRPFPAQGRVVTAYFDDEVND